MGYAIQNVSALPFGTLIGGPLSAAIEAQAQAAKATVDFIQVVGFNPPLQTEADGTVKKDPVTGESMPVDNDLLFPPDGADATLGGIRNITFSYSMKDVDEAQKEASLTVPILTIVPIPYIRIDSMDIDFMANISEQQTFTRAGEDEVKFGADLKVGYRSYWSPVSVNFRASFSTRHTSKTEASSRYQTEMTMNVHVKAVQDEMPGGLSRVLNILESTIKADITPAK